VRHTDHVSVHSIILLFVTYQHLPARHQTLFEQYSSSRRHATLASLVLSHVTATVVINPHERLIFYFLLSSFFRRLIFEVTENLDTYSLMTAIWKIWSELPRAFTPKGWGKNRFLGPTLNFDRTYLCNKTWYQQSERNLSCSLERQNARRTHARL